MNEPFGTVRPEAGFDDRPAGSETQDRLVSIVIPCYNQAGYLPDAIESALGQTYRPVEVVVVDDGSTEPVEETVAGFEGVLYAWQPNRGVAAARNAGFRLTRGAYVVFLDADDRLVPDGIRHGLTALGGRPRAAFAVGPCGVIGADGRPAAFRQARPIVGPVYRELLANNFIWMPAQVMFRRDAVAGSGGFDSRLDACADYDLYLRLARVSPVACHRNVVAEYRCHDGNMSHDGALMLRHALAALDRQWPHVKADPRCKGAYRAGRRHCQEFYGDRLVEQIRSAVRGLRSGKWNSQLLRSVVTLLRYHPAGFVRHLGRKLQRVASTPDLLRGSD